MTERTISVLRTHDDRQIPVYTIDPGHTSVEFVGRHLMITKESHVGRVRVPGCG